MELRFEPLTDPLSTELRALCRGAMPAGDIRVHPSATVITGAYQHYAQDILDLDVRHDDVWVISFPKCGTTWTQEMVWLLKNGFNFEKAKQIYLYERFPFVEYKPLWGEEVPDHVPDLIEHIKSLASPRFIKTHLPVELLPKQLWTKKPKVIYVFRNPKDAAISYFHHFRIWNNYVGPQELFLRAYVEDKGIKQTSYPTISVIFSPFWKHVISYWNLRKEPNVLFNTFEEMKQDLPSVLKKTADFLGVEYNEEDEAKLLKHLSFESMKANKSVNFEDDIRKIEQEKGEDGLSFMRLGEAGAWKKVLSPELAQLYDEWTAENLKGTDFPVFK